MYFGPGRCRRDRQAGVIHPRHLGWPLRNSATFGVLADAVHAQARVSMPWRIRKALNGLIAAPMLRSGTTRARPMKAAGPRASVNHAVIGDVRLVQAAEALPCARPTGTCRYRR